MCELTTIALAVSAAAGAYGAYSSSQAAKGQAEYQAEVERNNATIAGYQRDDAIQRGGEEANRVQREAERMRGTQVARLASNGLDINSGTPLAILEDSVFMGQQDAATARTNAAREAWGYDVQKQNALASADMYKTAAKNQKPWQAAGLSLLGSAGQYAMAGGFKSTGGGDPGGTYGSTGVKVNGQQGFRAGRGPGR